jgi:hypothetical protein
VADGHDPASVHIQFPGVQPQPAQGGIHVLHRLHGAGAGAGQAVFHRDAQAAQGGAVLGVVVPPLDGTFGPAAAVDAQRGGVWLGAQRIVGRRMEDVQQQLAASLISLVGIAAPLYTRPPGLVRATAAKGGPPRGPALFRRRAAEKAAP